MSDLQGYDPALYLKIRAEEKLDDASKREFLEAKCKIESDIDAGRTPPPAGWPTSKMSPPSPSRRMKGARRQGWVLVKGAKGQRGGRY